MRKAQIKKLETEARKELAQRMGIKDYRKMEGLQVTFYEIGRRKAIIKKISFRLFTEYGERLMEARIDFEHHNKSGEIHHLLTKVLQPVKCIPAPVLIATIT